MIEQVPDFNKLFERKTPAQVGEMLNAYLADDDAEEVSSETTKYGGAASDTQTSVDGAFSELLGQ